MRTLVIAFVLGAMSVSLGCRDTQQEFSEILHEDATISETVFTPSRHDVELGFTAFGSGSGGLGLDFGGNPGIGIGSGMQISSVTVPEKFAVVFKCAHGKFIVGRKKIYEILKGSEGKVADVTYREVYKTTYDNVDGKRQVVERALVGYDFIDATVK